MSAAKALQGLKVLDVTHIYSGPYCTMLLGDLGADVVKIEARGTGEDSRSFPPMKNGVSGYFTYLNRGKRSLELNLKSEAGRKAALDLAAWADVVVENHAPGALARLGLDYEAVRRVNPEVVYASISGFGQTGPYSDKLAYDAIIQAMSGYIWLTGYPDNPPVKAGTSISDAVTGIHTAFGIMAALHHKAATGKGQYLDMSLMDTMFSMLENAVPSHSFLGVEPMRFGNATISAAPYNMYRTSDGYVVIAAANNRLFAKLAGAMRRPELPEDGRFRENFHRTANARDLDALIEAWTLGHTTQEIEEALNAVAVPVARVFSVSELARDPHLAARGMLIDQDVPGVGTARFPGNPIKLRATPPDPSRRAPTLGEHTDEVLREVLGYSEDQIEAVKKG
jgi:crotonobetainyl-CoA:carnitine CoA-transferase CaiB-like acyl-CoA transferase